MPAEYTKHQLTTSSFFSVYVRSVSTLILGLSLQFFSHQLTTLLLGITYMVTGCSYLFAGTNYNRPEHKDRTLTGIYMLYGLLAASAGLIMLSLREDAIEYLVEGDAALLLGYAVFHLVFATILSRRHEKNQLYSLVLSVPLCFAVISAIALFHPFFSYEAWIAIMALMNCFYSGFAIGSVLVVKRSQNTI